MRKTFVVATVLLIAVALATVSLTSVVFATSTTGGTRKVGTATNVSGIIPITLISQTSSDPAYWGSYVCSSVNEKLVYVKGVPFEQDKQSCTLTSLGLSSLPTKALTQSGTYLNPPHFVDYATTGAAMYWISDYVFATQGTFLWADSWSYTVHPDGTLNIVSYYAQPCDTTWWDSTFTTQLCLSPH